MEKMRLKAKLYIGTVSVAGLAIIALQLAGWECQNVTRFFCYLSLIIVASSLKVSLPAITGTMSVNFLFILIGIVELSLPETIAIGFTGILVQCLWHAKSRPKAVQVFFNLAANAVATGTAYTVYHSAIFSRLNGGLPIYRMLLLMIATSVYFLLNTLSIAVVIAATEGGRVRKIWHDCYIWSFPYYLVGASIAWLAGLWSRYWQWQSSLIIVPVIYFIYRSYKLYLARLEDEKMHVEQMASLHLRTIESLALAIEAKDFTTHDHLRRVGVYVLEIAKELGMSEPEVEGLKAAALLHDIGKLAVPEHIISKPGKLTPEEFEKMKIHTVVGAEILERVQFPYPVVPIVRAHHEKWDGSGYPDGLKGEGIPLGARILAAVDCLDALASDRQYRRALPLAKAMAIVASEAGTSFDPRVVDVLARLYRSLEPKAQAETQDKSKLSTDVKITRGSGPAAGYESPQSFGYASSIPALSSIAAARQEAQMLFELTRDLGSSLSLDETLSVVAARLKRMVPYDAIAIYIRRETSIAPAYVNGEDYRLFSALEIPLGEGLSGWVAENKKPIVNGNPSVEMGYLNDVNKFSTLRSALCVPLDGVNGLVGVLALYKSQRDSFTKDHLRILLAISSKMSLAIENALKYRQAESSATTDYLTNLPNARSLFLRLDGELSRCKREANTLAILVGDLDGFKQLNDRFGHIAGNRILRLVSEALQTTCRQYDYVARMGGDEFVMILPGIRPRALADKVLLLRRTVTDVAQGIAEDCTLSISVGAASYPTDGDDAEQLLAEADRRMYKAKQNNKSKQRSVSEAGAEVEEMAVR
jgi:diguanylate cyclase (GGDEF)-like protein/putative nucleotidyltransferase with HDIG domain